MQRFFLLLSGLEQEARLTPQLLGLFIRPARVGTCPLSGSSAKNDHCVQLYYSNYV